jgi:methylated-DNA-protein-cysteine methyltransferase-like protein
MKKPGSRAPRRDGRRAARPPTAYDRIFAVVRRIPRGRVATYGQVAALAGLAHAPRVAGYALHALPQGTPLPWHRVVGAGGRLSLARKSPDGALTQRLRLEHEGVGFDARGRVDLARHAWRRARGACD